MNIVLHQPEIPQNTGNIGRTCMATGAALHLIEPLGFQLSDRQLARSGMDYWNELKPSRYVNFEDFRAKNPKGRVWMATTKAHRLYTDADFHPDDYIMFGKESAGIPEEYLVEYEKTCIRIPMIENARSLNLSNAVAVVLYEALRQQAFAHLEKSGNLHRLKWE